MTRIKKAFKLLIAGFVFLACFNPLQAAQKTDGQCFITNEVLGGGILPAVEAVDITGTLGQSLAIIGNSNSNQFTQNAGFWYALKQKSGLPIVSFMTHDVVLQNESLDKDIKIGLSKPSETPITVTVSVTTSPNCNNSDYTISNLTSVNTSEFIVVLDGSTTNEEISVQIIDDNDIEADESIQLRISNVEGDNAVIGNLNTLTFTIPENDAFPITGTVKYMGSQTGSLIVQALDSQTGVKVDEFPSEWTTQTTELDYALEVAPGNYTILAFIDSASGDTGNKETWEACGVYTNVANDVDEAINITMDDPENRYKDQYSEETDSYKDWIANFPNIGGPGADFDEDGYSNFQEFINGTNPTQDNPAYAFDGYDPGTDTRTSDLSRPYQMITTNPLKPQTQMGENASFLVDINYTTSDYNDEFTVNKNNGGTTGLGLLVHFNSSEFELAAVYNPLTDNLAQALSTLTNVVDEGEFDDGYDDTDKMVSINWLNTSSTWPYNKNLPIRLCTLKFTVKANLQGLEYGDTSVIRFTAQDMDVRYDFYASPSIVEFNEFNFDIDGNGTVDALTDGIQIVRYMFELLDEEDTSIATDTGEYATRTTVQEIYDYIHNGRSCLDIDKNGEPKAQSDGLMLLRYMFELWTKESLIENAIGPNAQNTTADEVIPYIEQYMPREGSDKLKPKIDE
jgi:hypothetical protein